MIRLTLLLTTLAMLQDQEMVKAARAMQKEVTAIRGLEFKTDVSVGTYSRKELSDHLRREDPQGLENYRRLHKVLSHFGLVRQDLDLEEVTKELLGSSLAGFYDAKRKELRLIIDQKSAQIDIELAKLLDERFGYKVNLQNVTLVHELCHAAQDQAYDLGTLPAWNKANDDVGLAVRALVEGDATVVGLRHGLGDSFDTLVAFYTGFYKTGGEGPGGGPKFMRRGLLFPYGYGTEFVLKLLGRPPWDWKRVGDAFADLPTSTEQIMHPRKYMTIDRDHPKSVMFDPSGALDGWTEIESNVFGEFGISVLLDEYELGTAKARTTASEGWGGDRYRVYEDAKGNVASFWGTTWDFRDDAEEFFAAYLEVLKVKYDGWKSSVTKDKATFAIVGRRTVMSLNGAEVLIADNVEDKTAVLLPAVWSTFKKEELRKIGRVPRKP